MNFRIPAIVLTLAAFFVTGAVAQTLTDEEMTQRLEAVREASMRSRESLLSYSWQQRTELWQKGKVKSFRIEEVSFDAGGNLVYQPIGGKDGKMSQAKKTGDFLDRLNSLAEHYMYPDAEKLLVSNRDGNVRIEQRPDANWARLHVRNYYKDGDRLEMLFDTARQTIRSLDASTYLERDELVTVVIEFSTLPDGTNYAAGAVVNAPSKQIQLKTVTKGHRKTNTGS